MNIEKQQFTASDRMRDLIEADSNLLMVMTRFGISLGFGDKTVATVCREQDVDVRTFLTVANFMSGRDADYRNVSLSPLISYLRRAHVYFLDFKLQSIRRSLLEAIDCSGTDEAAFLILRFYDEYVTEVRRHMEYENEVVFGYVDNLLDGRMSPDFEIGVFARKHNHIDSKLKELKDIIVCYYPQKGNDQLCSVLFDIISCEQDLNSHCSVEDEIFVPAVEMLEQSVRLRGGSMHDAQDSSMDQSSSSNILSQREKDIVVCIAKGMSSKEIADCLNISVNTVTTHRRNISSKLQIHTPSGLAIYAIINSLVTLDELRTE